MWFGYALSNVTLLYSGKAVHVVETMMVGGRSENKGYARRWVPHLDDDSWNATRS
jgi:hypothetical protein